MPIRFRCPTCTGLMSIARRKSNTVVACPKCGEQVIVPAAEPAAALAGATNGPPASPVVDRPLFERTDFDGLLSKAGVAPPPTPAKPVAPPPEPVRQPVRQPEPATIVLSYPAAAMLAVGCVALVAAGFAAGYLLR